MAAAVSRTVFAQPDADAASDTWDEVAAQLGARSTKVAALMAHAKPEVGAFAVFPRAHRQKIWSTNPLERINKEIKRRSRVVGIFPNQASASSQRSSLTSTTNAKPQTAATSQSTPRPPSTPSATPSPQPSSHPATDTEPPPPPPNPPLHGTSPWAAENGVVGEVPEDCIARAVSSRTEAACARTDRLDVRRPVMQSWADDVAS